MPKLTISRKYRPLDKTLGLAGLRKQTRRQTAQQRVNDAAKRKERHKRCAHRSSSSLEVAVFSARTAATSFLVNAFPSRRNEEAEERPEAPKRRKKDAEAEKPQRKRSRCEFP